jgi:hypothetical protein
MVDEGISFKLSEQGYDVDSRPTTVAATYFVSWRANFL